MKRKRSFLDAVSGSVSASGSSSASATASTAALCVFDKVEEYSGGGYDVYDDDDDDGGLDEYGVSVNGKVICSLHSDVLQFKRSFRLLNVTKSVNKN